MQASSANTGAKLGRFWGSRYSGEVTLVARSFAFGLAVFGGLLSSAAPARAESHWHEARLAGDDARIVVSAQGHADVERKLRLVVTGGIVDTMTASGVPADAELDPKVDVSSEAGESLVATATRDTDRVKITFEPAKGTKVRGLRRGSYVFTLRYGMDLVQTGALTKEGVFFTLRWQQPAAAEGRDNVRAVFDLPEGRVPPELLAAGEEKESTALTTLRRSGGREELDVLRAHVPRGEATNLGVRIDAKAFAPLRTPDPASNVARKRSVAPVPAHEASALVRVAVPMACFLVAFTLVRRKKQALRARELTTGVRVRSLVPLPPSVSPFVAGALAAGGASTLGTGSGLVAAILASAFALVVTHRTAPPSENRRPSGGRWVALRPTEAFEAEPYGSGDLLDGSRGRGVAGFVVVTLAGLLGAVWLQRVAPSVGYRAPLALFALAPLWFTGVAAQFPPTWQAVAARSRSLFEAIERTRVHVVPWARVNATGEIVELRLRVVPRDPLPGAHAVEVAFAVPLQGASYTLLPALVLRVDDGSYAHAKALAIQASADSLPGRKDGERVLLVPLPAGSPDELAARVAETVELLSDRRARRAAEDAPGSRPVDRRLPAPARVARMLSELPAGPIFG